MRFKSEQTLIRVGAATREQAVRDFKAAVEQLGWSLSDEDIEVFDYDIGGNRRLYASMGSRGDAIFIAPVGSRAEYGATLEAATEQMLYQNLPHFRNRQLAAGRVSAVAGVVIVRPQP